MHFAGPQVLALRFDDLTVVERFKLEADPRRLTINVDCARLDTDTGWQWLGPGIITIQQWRELAVESNHGIGSEQRVWAVDAAPAIDELQSIELEGDLLRVHGFGEDTSEWVVYCFHCASIAAEFVPEPAEGDAD